ncbi:MAG: hypothetical protein KDB84_11410 [Flavobacteriales bacterium]|nr:hypothetical protein [Flavobacteriales bacterium]
MRSPLLLAPVLFLLACGDGKKEAAEQLADTANVPAPWVIDLAPYDVPAVVELGDKATLRVDSATVAWNEEFGHLEVSAGDHFAIRITEDRGDMARLKADMERDMLRKHTVTEESPDLLIYRSQFPDEDLVFVHFYRIIRTHDRTFIVEDDPEGRFNEADIQRMERSVTAQGAI